MNISELAVRSGTTVYTIRYYEKIGMFDSDELCREANNYRNFSENAVVKLGLIRTGKSAGFTLQEMKEISGHLKDTTINAGMRYALLSGKLTEVNKRIAELLEIKKVLEEKINKKAPVLRQLKD